MCGDINKIKNHGSDTGKYNKSTTENRERGFTNVAKIPKTIMLKITNQDSDTDKRESRESGFAQM